MKLPFPIVLLLISAVPQASSAQVPPSAGTELRPEDGVALYRRAPSNLIGNAFNSEIGTADAGTDYQVLDQRSYPSTRGLQVWVEIAPVDGSAADDCVAGGCWAEYGTIGRDGVVSNQHFSAPRM